MLLGRSNSPGNIHKSAKSAHEITSCERESLYASQNQARRRENVKPQVTDEDKTETQNDMADG